MVVVVVVVEVVVAGSVVVVVVVVVVGGNVVVVVVDVDGTEIVERVVVAATEADGCGNQGPRGEHDRPTDGQASAREVRIRFLDHRVERTACGQPSVVNRT